MGRDFKKKEMDESGDIQKHDNGMCVAHGCPLYGSISTSVHGSHSWLCNQHFRAPVANWQTVTARIRKNMLLVNLAKEIRMAQNGMNFDVQGWIGRLQDAGMMEYAPTSQDRTKDTGRLSPRLWLSRIEKTLYGITMAGMDVEQRTSGSVTGAEILMDEIEKFLKAHWLNGFVA